MNRGESQLLAAPPGWLLQFATGQGRGRLRPDGDRLELPTGKRNDWMFRFGSLLRSFGLSAETIHDCLAAINARHCRPQLDGDELQKTARSAAGYPLGHREPRPVRQDRQGDDAMIIALGLGRR